jgi:hypothetical protein
VPQEVVELNNGVKVGAEISDFAFGSYSKDWVIADCFARQQSDKGVRFNIHAERGKVALDVTHSAALGTREFEVIWPRGQKWRVKNVASEGRAIEIEPAE